MFSKNSTYLDFSDRVILFSWMFVCALTTRAALASQSAINASQSGRSLSECSSVGCWVSEKLDQFRIGALTCVVSTSEDVPVALVSAAIFCFLAGGLTVVGGVFFCGLLGVREARSVQD